MPRSIFTIGGASSRGAIIGDARHRNSCSVSTGTKIA